MNNEDKVTADRLTAAGTTQTPLTDAICPLGLWRDNTAPHYVIELAGHARSLELALAASKAREAELVKALDYWLPLEKPLVGCTDKISVMHRKRWFQAKVLINPAPPTNSKEMNK